MLKAEIATMFTEITKLVEKHSDIQKCTSRFKDDAKQNTINAQLDALNSQRGMVYVLLLETISRAYSEMEAIEQMESYIRGAFKSNDEVELVREMKKAADGNGSQQQANK